MISALSGAMDVGDLMPSYDRLVWSEDGDLWVRTMGPEVADVHPYLMAVQAVDGPAHRLWDVFNPTDGTVRTVRIPAELDARVMDGSIVYGFRELPTGEIAIGRATVPGPDVVPAG